MQPKWPRFIDWATTPKCNLNCRHCRGMAQGELSTERARSLIGEMAELKPDWVIVEGGEPLLREDLFTLLSLMQQKQLRAHLITNGTLLTPHIMASLKSAGTRVMISIDGGTAITYEAIRQGASFEKVLEKARRCAELGLLESLNFTVMKANFHEIPAFFAVAKSVGVKQVTLIGFKPCHGYREEVLTTEEYAEAIRLACQGAQETGVSFFFDEPFFQAVVKEKGYSVKMPAVDTGILASSTSACIFGEYLFIDPNGDVKPCSFAPLVLGNVRQKRLNTIWSEVLSSPFFRKITDHKNRTGWCGDCRHLVDCGGCRSRTFLLAGDWFAADPCCPLSDSVIIQEGK